MKKILLLSSLFLATTTVTHASTLSYKFLIPAFGGNPDYFYVFKSEADAQNIYHAPSKPTSKTSQIEEFKNRLQYLILSKLASKIANAAFGEGELNPGTYEIGNFQIQVVPSDTEIQVHLVDTTTGNETIVEVPMYKQ